MPRKARRQPEPQPRPLVGSSQRVDTFGGRDFIVRTVSGSAATKPYRCPGCDHMIASGTPHVVTWPRIGETLSGGGLEERRHWHNGCWQARGRRGLG